MILFIWIDRWGTSYEMPVHPMNVNEAWDLVTSDEPIWFRRIEI